MELKQNEIKQKLNEAEAKGAADLNKLKVEADELKRQEEEFAKKEADLLKKERVIIMIICILMLKGFINYTFGKYSWHHGM